MEIKIVKGSIDYINDCEDTLVNSELGIRYFFKSDGDSFTPSDRSPVTLYLILQSVVRATCASLIHSNKGSYQDNAYVGFQIVALLSKFPFLMF